MFKLYPCLALAAFFLVSPLPALAQKFQSLDQYPSYIEYMSQTPDGTQTIVRCGYYAVDKHTISFDPAFQETLTINGNKAIYSRLQHIDDSVIATSPAPAGSLGLLLQLVTPDGKLIARNCQTDAGNDTIHDCKPVQAIESVDQIKIDDRKLGQQCTNLLNQTYAKVNPADADDTKAKEFKDSLRQKIQTLLAN